MATKASDRKEKACFLSRMITHEGYLEFKITGENRPDTIVGYLQEIHSSAMQLGQRHVLIEEHLSGPPLGIGAIFDILAEVSQTFDPPLTRIAYIDLSENRDPSKLKYAETAAQNRGIPIRFFNDRVTAVSWLSGT